MSETFDVAIVGYGPTGMTAAALLAQRGHDVVVIERWPGLYGLPRLTHMDDESARILQEVCDIDVALSDATPTQYKWVNGDGEVLLRIPNWVGNQGYDAHMSIYQPDIETAIDARLRSLPNVTLRQGWVVLSVVQGDDDVALEIAPFVDRTPDRSRSRIVRAKYVVGADGNKSVVRSHLGVDQRDFGFEETWVNIDTEWRHERPEEYVISTQHCDPARGHMTMGIGTRRQRFEYAVLPGEDPKELSQPDYGWDWLRRVHGLGPDDLVVSRQLAYTFVGRITDRWRVGRVFLAGDAAHVMPPYLGQGACSGIRDASNLAWKLDLVLRGRADETLLDTYQLEREPHAEAAVRGSIQLGHIANTNDPVEAAERDRMMMSGGGGSDASALPRLTGGALRRSASDPLSGTVSPQGVIRLAGVTGRADDVLGAGFQLIVAPGAWDLLDEETRRRAEDAVDVLEAAVLNLGDADTVDVSGVYQALLDEAGVSFVLVRPDHIVFGSATAEDVADMLRAAQELTLGQREPVSEDGR